eukprot:scaffold64892_cov17-Tisochrysis_lutea.AAC.2
MRLLTKGTVVSSGAWQDFGIRCLQLMPSQACSPKMISAPAYPGSTCTWKQGTNYQSGMHRSLSASGYQFGYVIAGLNHGLSVHVHWEAAAGAAMLIFPKQLHWQVHIWGVESGQRCLLRSQYGQSLYVGSVPSADVGHRGPRCGYIRGWWPRLLLEEGGRALEPGVLASKNCTLCGSWSFGVARSLGQGALTAQDL